MPTPLKQQQSLAHALGLQKALYFKREDEGPFHSHKGRIIPYLIDQYIQEGFTHFALSSSGNAGYVGARYIHEINKQRQEKISLDIYFGAQAHPEKVNRLQQYVSEHIHTHTVARPLQELHKLIHNNPIIKSLRQSKDPFAVQSLAPLAEELIGIPDLHAIFIPTSSGTTARALGTYMKKVEIHIVQTTATHPIAGMFDTQFEEESRSDASAIVDRIAYQKEIVKEIIKKSNGNGWVISNAEIKQAQSIVEIHTGIALSPTSALSVAGLQKALRSGYTPSGSIICLITGA